MVQRGWDI